MLSEFLVALLEERKHREALQREYAALRRHRLVSSVAALSHFPMLRGFTVTFSVTPEPEDRSRELYTFLGQIAELAIPFLCDLNKKGEAEPSEGRSEDDAGFLHTMPLGQVFEILRVFHKQWHEDEESAGAHASAAGAPEEDPGEDSPSPGPCCAPDGRPEPPTPPDDLA